MVSETKKNTIWDGICVDVLIDFKMLQMGNNAFRKLNKITFLNIFVQKFFNIFIPLKQLAHPV